jgi:hypothetical protein
MCKWREGITMLGLALGGLLLTGIPAAAQGVYGPTIDSREEYQQQRIQRGIDSGALTPGEARNLEREQGRIRAAEQRMEADGRLSPWERQRLRQMQDRASRDINRLEQNNRTTAGWSGHTNSRWRGNNDGGWDRRGYAWQGNHPGGRGYPPGSAGYPQGQRGNGTYGWRDKNTGGNGTTGNWTPTAGNTQAWRGNHTAGIGTPPSGSPTPGITQNTYGYRGNKTGTGTTPTGTPTAGNTQAWRGNHTGGIGTTPSGNPTPGTTQNTYGYRGKTTGTSTTPSGITTAGTTPSQQGNYNRNGQSGPFQQPGTRPQSPQQYQQARPQMAQPAIRPNAGMMPRQPAGIGSMASRASYSAPRAASRRR